MREFIDILEAKKVRTTKAPDLSDIENKLKEVQNFLSKYPFNISFSNEWVDTLKSRVGQAKIGHEKNEAEGKERDGEHFEASSFHAKDLFLELVPKLLARSIHTGVILKDIERAEQEYQSSKVSDPENPHDFVEDSDVIRFNHAQKNVTNSLAAIIPSHPETFTPLTYALDGLKAVHDHKMQHDELSMDEDLKDVLSKLIPLLRICNLLKSRL